MNFRQSAVTSLTRETCHESWHKLPEDIQPVHLGSGEIALSIDATGMQGLNSRMNHQPDMSVLESVDWNQTRTLDLFRDEALSRHYDGPFPLVEGAKPQYSLFPFGWIGYSLVIDGQKFDTSTILESARQWRRSWTPRTGLCVTEFTLGVIRLKWTMGVRCGGVEVDAQVEAQTLDGQRHELQIDVFTSLTLRDGRPIAKKGVEYFSDESLSGAFWHATDQTSTAKVKHPIQVTWAWVCEHAATPWSQENAYGLVWSGRGQCFQTGFRLVFGSDRDGTHTEEYLVASADEFQLNGATSALGAVAKSWQDFFANAAEYRIGDAEKEFIAANCIYTLRAGSPWHSGMPLGTLWIRKFLGGTFWDSFYAADGMLRSGFVEPIREFCEWLNKTAAKKGRPHMWITWYDGEAATQPHEDKAYINALAYASIGIRLYEVTRDEEDLRLRVYPYLKTICTYLLEELFVQDKQGHWYMQGEVSGDVGIETVDAKDQTDSLVWSVLCLSKFAQYSQVMDIDSKLVQRANRIANYFRQNKIVLNHSDCWYTWFPYICPVDGEMADYGSWWKPQDAMLVKKFQIAPAQTLEKDMIGDNAKMQMSPFIGTYTGMPWANCCVSGSFTMTGHSGLALEYFDAVSKYVSGMGYLTESVYETRIGGNSPYIPSSGAFLAAFAMFFAAGTLFDDTVDIGVNLPGLWRGLNLEWSNVVSINGARISGMYSPSEASCHVSTLVPRKLRVRVPLRIAGEPLIVKMGDKSAKFKYSTDVIEMIVPAGEHTIQIKADHHLSHDIILIEPMPLYSEKWCKLLTGKKSPRVRVLRDMTHLSRIQDSSALIIYHQSYVGPSEDVNRELLERVKSGASLLLFEHAVYQELNHTLAEASGVRGRYDYVWRFQGKDEPCQLTPAGKKLLKGMPAQFALRTLHDIKASPLKDVEILAVTPRTGQPIITRRAHGKGAIWWCGAGSRSMDRPDVVGWGLQFAREQFVFGRNREEFMNHQWLESPDLKALLQSIIHLTIKSPGNIKKI
ncbi:hypothetical protein QPK87_24220 [Kamptonema cortianum]|nr:hypothetical protein [Oscillatoria laete-virens]MDK3159652.1 hypothetical protein [Kamptonema cortianum]MDL5050299.1 hypothetical protein [Oscillatoria amoena NRMC-F 0135]MDL5055131.1 hypothetical protein [Oscillatoria laete-virens NRMC-F 0139]